MAGVHGVPAVEFRHGPEMYEPVHLDGLPEVAGGMGRDPVAYGGNLLEFRLADRVGAGCGHFLREGGMALSQQDRGVAGDAHRIELLLLVGRLRVVDVIQRGDILLDPGLHVQQALAVHPAVHGSMARGALLHELGEHAGVISLLPLLGDMVENTFPLRLPLPIRDYLALVRVDILLADVIRLQLPGIQHVKILHAVAGQFRERRNRLRPGTALAHDQLVRADIQRFFRADFIEILCAENRNRILAVVLLVERGLDEGALDGEGGGRRYALLPEAPHARIHSPVIFGMLDGERHASACLAA